MNELDEHYLVFDIKLWSFCEHNSEYSELQQFSSCINNKLLSMKLNNYIIKHFTTLSCLKLSRIFHFSTDGEVYVWFNLIIHYICCNEISGFYIWLNKVILFICPWVGLKHLKFHQNIEIFTLTTPPSIYLSQSVQWRNASCHFM